MNNEPTNTSTTRIKPTRKVSEPLYIDVRDLEGIREIELAQRRERIDEFKSRNC